MIMMSACALQAENCAITVGFTDLGKLNFATAPVASKNDTCYKSGQTLLKNNYLATLVKISETDCIIGIKCAW